MGKELAITLIVVVWTFAVAFVAYWHGIDTADRRNALRRERQRRENARIVTDLLDKHGVDIVRSAR
jgi:hypothetical protein